jgi:hypothetical protein
VDSEKCEDLTLFERKYFNSWSAYNRGFFIKMCVAGTSTQRDMFENLPFRMTIANACGYTNNPEHFKACSDKYDRYEVFTDYSNFKHDRTDPRCVVYSQRGVNAMWLDPLDGSELSSLKPIRMTLTIMPEPYTWPLYLMGPFLGVFVTLLVFQYPIRYYSCTSSSKRKKNSNENVVKPEENLESD